MYSCVVWSPIYMQLILNWVLVIWQCDVLWGYQQTVTLARNSPDVFVYNGEPSTASLCTDAKNKFVYQK